MFGSSVVETAVVNVYTTHLVRDILGNLSMVRVFFPLQTLIASAVVKAAKQLATAATVVVVTIAVKVNHL